MSLVNPTWSGFYRTFPQSPVDYLGTLHLVPSANQVMLKLLAITPSSVSTRMVMLRDLKTLFGSSVLLCNDLHIIAQ